MLGSSVYIVIVIDIGDAIGVWWLEEDKTRYFM